MNEVMHGEITGSTPEIETRRTLFVKPIVKHPKQTSTLALKDSLAITQKKKMNQNNRKT
jgi:hypothetical protein